MNAVVGYVGYQQVGVREVANNYECVVYKIHRSLEEGQIRMVTYDKQHQQHLFYSGTHPEQLQILASASSRTDLSY